MSRFLPSVLCGLVVLMAFAPGVLAQDQTCLTFSAVPYGTYLDGNGQLQELKLDLRIPTGIGAPAPLVVWVHGGGWSGGTRAMPGMVSNLCSRGYAVASIDYRLSGTALWPAQIQDCKGALRWLRANAGLYNLDPNRIGVWGSSAGGHLVAHLGTSGGVGKVTVGGASVDLEGATGGNLEQSSRVQAVVDWFGPTDLLQMRFHPSGIPHDDAGSPEGHLIGGPVPDNPDLVATVNPITFLSPDDPPFLLMHGTVDDSVPFAESELLYRALAARGLRASFVPILGAGHGGGDFNSQTTLDRVLAFLDANLLSLPAPVVSLTAGAQDFGESSGSPVTFTISRTGSPATPLTVRVSFSGTATANVDFTSSNPQVTLPAGATSATVTVTSLDDGLIEGKEDVVLTLAQSTTYRLAAGQTSAAVTLADDESSEGRPTVSITATDGVASETGPDAGSFRVARTGSTATSVVVGLRTTGTATVGTDFSALPASVTLPAGQASVDVAVSPAVDSLLETTETVILSVLPGVDYVVDSGAGTAGVRIYERDQASALPIVSTVAIDFQSAEPGANPGAFLVTRTGATTGTLSVNLVPGGTATGGVDYTALPASVVFGAGINRVTVPLSPLDDTSVEGAEMVSLRAAPSAALLAGPAGAPVTISDDDAP